MRLALALVAFSACAESTAKAPIDAAPLRPSATTTSAAVEAPPNRPPEGDARKGESLAGVVMQKPTRAKDAETWQATGGDDVGSGTIESYLVLDTGSDEPKQRSAKEGVILRGSDGAIYQGLLAAVGKRVRVYGSYVAGRPYVPKDPGEQYPMGMDGKPLPRGAGFRVVAFEPL